MLQGHALAARLETDDCPFPFLALIVSGGHTQLVYCRDVGKYKLIGTTLDDSIGESFDKIARMLAVPSRHPITMQPAHPGAAVEAYARYIPPLFSRAR